MQLDVSASKRLQKQGGAEPPRRLRLTHMQSFNQLDGHSNLLKTAGALVANEHDLKLRPWPGLFPTRMSWLVVNCVQQSFGGNHDQERYRVVWEWLDLSRVSRAL